MHMPQPAGTNRPIDVAGGSGRRGILALWLAVLAVPGVWFTWDLLPLGGYYTGVPLAIGAVALGVQARGRPAASTGGNRTAGTVAVALGAACLAFVAVWTVVELALGTIAAG
ncbi:hypothetical protein ACU61A_30375 [Pseudonocardia sichuanensis]